MKILKKVISLAMAVIMMITATPVLQASDFSNLNMGQLRELQEEILPSVMDEVNPETDNLVNKNDEKIPTLKELQDRYKKALENYKKLKEQAQNKNFKEFEKKKKEEALKKDLEDKKGEALEIAKQNNLFEYFENDKERMEVAFYTFLFDSMRKNQGAKFEKGMEKVWYIATIVEAGVGGYLTGDFIVADLIYELSQIDSVIVGAFFATIFALLTFALLPANDPNATGSVIQQDWDTVKYDFLRKPFDSVSNLYINNHFASFYHKSEDCRKILRDIVDIEYYISRNLSGENMMYRILPYTDYWHKMSCEEKEEYLSKAAQFLREQASQYKMPFDKSEGYKSYMERLAH